MNALEAAAFETDPDLDIIIRMRFWDDEAKLTDIPVDNMNQLKAIAIAHLSNHE